MNQGDAMRKSATRFPKADLGDLGQRILVMGPSNAGKSTLAVALSEKLGLEVVHLDQLRHLPNTDWVPRPDGEFKQLHDAAILGESWVIDGNYSALLTPRLSRATGVIVLNSSVSLRFARYLKRTMLNRRARAGHLEGAQDSLKWMMIDWILFKTRKNAARYAKIVRATGKPSVECQTAQELRFLYEAWDLNTVR